MGGLASLFEFPAGDIELNFDINVGLPLVTLLDIEIGPFVLFSFAPSNPPPPANDGKTIFIKESNQAEKINVFQTSYPDPGVTGDIIQAIEVDYSDHSELYPTAEFHPKPTAS